MIFKVCTTLLTKIFSMYNWIGNLLFSIWFSSSHITRDEPLDLKVISKLQLHTWSNILIEMEHSRRNRSSLGYWALNAETVKTTRHLETPTSWAAESVRASWGSVFLVGDLEHLKKGIPTQRTVPTILWIFCLCLYISSCFLGDQLPHDILFQTLPFFMFGKSF